MNQSLLDKLAEHPDGFFFFWRCIRDTDLWSGAPYSPLKLWLWLLSEAKIRPKGILQPGQLSHSYRFMVEALTWLHPEKHRPIAPHHSTIKKDLEEFAQKGMILIVPGSISKGSTVITICNWSSYQAELPPGVSQREAQAEAQREAQNISTGCAGCVAAE